MSEQTQVPKMLTGNDLLTCPRCGHAHNVSAEAFRLFGVRWFPCDKCEEWMPGNSMVLAP